MCDIQTVSGILKIVCGNLKTVSGILKIVCGNLKTVSGILKIVCGIQTILLNSYSKMCLYFV